jgi:hypothetical protein
MSHRRAEGKREQESLSRLSKYDGGDEVEHSGVDSLVREHCSEVEGVSSKTALGGRGPLGAEEGGGRESLLATKAHQR